MRTLNGKSLFHNDIINFRKAINLFMFSNDKISYFIREPQFDWKKSEWKTFSSSFPERRVKEGENF